MDVTGRSSFPFPSLIFLVAQMQGGQRRRRRRRGGLEEKEEEEGGKREGGKEERVILCLKHLKPQRTWPPHGLSCRLSCVIYKVICIFFSRVQVSMFVFALWSRVSQCICNLICAILKPGWRDHFSVLSSHILIIGNIWEEGAGVETVWRSGEPTMISLIWFQYSLLLDLYLLLLWVWERERGYYMYNH